MKKVSIYLFIIIIVLVGFFFIFKNKNNILTQEKPINDFQSCLDAENIILESYPRQCRTNDGRIFVEEIGNELEKSDLIIIDNPRPNQKISSPLQISGRARGFWFFEASFPILLVDKNDQLISQTIAQTQSEWMTEEFVPFVANLEFPNDLFGQAKLIFKKDNPSGLLEHDDQLEVPIFLKNIDKIKIKVFFNNGQLDPEFSCNKVFPVEREVEKTISIGMVALEELLKGPSEIEEINGYFTNINSGVKIQKLTINQSADGGIARVDFDKQLEFEVGGSCRVGAIRAQIEETLKQFSTVDQVIISINDRIEDILQP